MDNSWLTGHNCVVKCNTSVYKLITITTTEDVPTSPAEVEVLLLSLPFWSHDPSFRLLIECLQLFGLHDHFPVIWLVTLRLFLFTCHMISINNSD